MSVTSDEKTQRAPTHQRAEAKRESSSPSTASKCRSKVMLIIAQITIASAALIVFLSAYIQWIYK